LIWRCGSATWPTHRSSLAGSRRFAESCSQPPAYLAERGRPGHPRDLNGHDVVIYANAGQAEQWRFKVGEEWEQVRGRSRFRADNGELIRAAAERGLGICILPTFIASPSIASGTLEVILRDFPWTMPASTSSCRRDAQ
jgi:DNA-binding transcriptional LysR family regulator